MSTKFSMTRDINGYNGFGLMPADDKWRAVLIPNIEDHFTIPATYENWLAIFAIEPGNSIWVTFNNTATVPSGGFSTTVCELNPVGRQLKAGDVISMITGDQTNDAVGVLLYAL